MPGVATHLLAPVNRARRGRAGAAAHAPGRARGGAHVRRRSAPRGDPGDPGAARPPPGDGDVLRRRRAGAPAAGAAGADPGAGPPGRAARRPPPAAAAAGARLRCSTTCSAAPPRSRTRSASDPAGTVRRTGSTVPPGLAATRAAGLAAAAVVTLGQGLATADDARAESPAEPLRGLLPGDVILLHDADFYSSRGSHLRTAGAVEIVLVELSRRKLCTVLPADVVARAHTG